VQAQTRQCLTHIAAMNEEHLRWFPADPPARVPGLKVSIAAIARA